MLKGWPPHSTSSGRRPPPRRALRRPPGPTSRYTDRTLALYRALRAGGVDNVEVVLQSYLHRTDHDLETLLPLRPRVRLVKGAYAEASSIAYAQKAEVDASYRRLTRRLLEAPAFPAIATHDDFMRRLAERPANVGFVVRSPFSERRP